MSLAIPCSMPDDVYDVVPPKQCLSCTHSFIGDYFEIEIGSFGPHLFFSKPIKTLCCKRGRNPTWIGAQQAFYILMTKNREAAWEKLKNSFLGRNKEYALKHYGTLQKPCGWFKSSISEDES
jgi:hypothetical protein